MPVLKSATSRTLIKEAIVLDMGDLDRQAKRILEEARDEAAQIVADARREAGELTAQAADIGRKQGTEQGLAEGRECGKEEGRRETIEELRPRLTTMLESWSGTLEQWESDRADMLLAARHDVLAFALEMGKRIALRTMEADPSVVVDQAAAALEYLTKPTAVTITVHPEDRALLEEALPELLARFARCTQASIRENAAMQRGGCMVETGAGAIDATIETQIERIVDALLPSARQGETTDV